MQLQADAGLKNTKNVITRLDTLVEQGFASIAIFNRKEFSFLADNETFNRLKLEVDANANPCLHNAVHKKLDFWLGEWDVYVAGNKTAESFITKSQGGCTLHEDYRTESGFYGEVLITLILKIHYTSKFGSTSLIVSSILLKKMQRMIYW